MSEPSDPAAFRASATIMYKIACVGLVLGVPAAAGGGWYYGGWLWLAVAGAGALVIGAAVWVAITILWVLSQDGA